MLAIGSLVPLPSRKPAWTSGSSRFTYCWSLPWRIEHYFTSVWDECNCAVVWAFFGIAFLWDWNENWPFPVRWPLLSFPNLLAYWVHHYRLVMVRGLHNSMKLWVKLCRATQDGRVIVKSSDKMWSTGEGNDKPPQYSCLEKPMNSIEKVKSIWHCLMLLSFINQLMLKLII